MAITPVSVWQKAILLGQRFAILLWRPFAIASGVGFVGVENVSPPKRMARWGRRWGAF
ncbi:MULTISPECIES: hypothetical protein [Oscillatoriophycideae]|uniref:hypothetical protein n=1 Tax=Oscillatoriophycideae TaxID=1301283 RepID=UPI0012F8D805|nr:hypothetical protein HFV01_09180 [Limnospira fusiformis SAG 85.79]QNH56005.1 MAG: hypothetical protein H2674_16580 [Limnospira indica BM01]